MAIVLELYRVNATTLHLWYVCSLAIRPTLTPDSLSVASCGKTRARPSKSDVMTRIFVTDESASN